MIISIWDVDAQQWYVQKKSHGCVIEAILSGAVIRTNIHDCSDPTADELNVWVIE